MSGFGRGTSFLRYVSQNLVTLFLQSNELEEILNEMNKLKPNSNMKYIDDKVMKLNLNNTPVSLDY